jgi:hypothetical protein
VVVVIPADALRAGDRFRYEGQTFTVAVSEPDDLNGAGWWHIEAEEPGEDTAGWPWSMRCSVMRPFETEGP